MRGFLFLVSIVCTTLGQSLCAGKVPPSDIYISFDGSDPSDWRNLGDEAFGEVPWRIGSVNAPVIGVSPNGISGNAWDGRHFVSKSLANCPVWGTDREEQTNTCLEKVLPEQTAFTVAMWIRTDATQEQGRLLKTPAFQINYRGDHLQIAIGQPIEKWHNSERSNFFTSVKRWIFVAVTYRELSDSGQLKFYAGNQSGDVRLLGTVATPKHRLKGDSSGCWLSVGNSEPDGNRPFVGMIDEFRLWAGSALAFEELQKLCVPMDVANARQSVERGNANMVTD